MSRLTALLRGFGALLVLVALVLAPAASARPRLGIFGPIDRFASLTGQDSSVGHVILSWNQLPNAALGPNYTTAMFRKAFARTYLLLHGGAKNVLDAKLRKLGLPPVAQDLPENPMPRVRVIWNPQGYGSPDRPGNRAQAYYPGDAYVDVVGNDLYDIRFKAEWAANDALRTLAVSV